VVVVSGGVGGGGGHRGGGGGGQWWSVTQAQLEIELFFPSPLKVLGINWFSQTHNLSEIL
jgi:hypothetical protein